MYSNLIVSHSHPTASVKKIGLLLLPVPVPFKLCLNKPIGGSVLVKPVGSNREVDAFSEYP